METENQKYSNTKANHQEGLEILAGKTRLKKKPMCNPKNIYIQVGEKNPISNSKI